MGRQPVGSGLTSRSFPTSHAQSRMDKASSESPVAIGRDASGLPHDADGLAVFLDVDGTLLEIAGSPGEVRVEMRLRHTLKRLRARLGGAVALISGRRIDDLDGLFGMTDLPTAGLHGLERRSSNGDIVRGAAASLSAPERQRLVDFAGAHPGVFIEDKGAAVALHYRAAPAAEPAARSLAQALVGANSDELDLLDGKKVLEIRRRGSHKGDAIADFLREPPFAGRRPVFVGDDVTDEDGFAVVNRLGGCSVCVGNNPHSRARWRLPDVAAVISWLEELAGSERQAGTR